MNLLQTECKETNAVESTIADHISQKVSLKKVCVLTNGCPENRIDCSRIQKFVGDNGCTVIADIKEADVIVFNAC